MSRALLSWIASQGIGAAHFEPGKPRHNRTFEIINGKLCDERLSLECFRSRAQAKVVTERWLKHNNAIRPHSSQGHLTPTEFVKKLNAAAAQATGREAAVCGPSRRSPLHHSPTWDKMTIKAPISQVKFGPKNRLI